MKFGLFDHLERSPDRSLATQFDERLDFVAAADQAGFYALHVAEHHSTPLNMVPEPGVWLAAVARATKTIRLGPLVYLLPLYSPVRLAEEICMLDHMSGGRLEVGVGRGVSPYEIGYHKVPFEKSREMFLDGFACLTTALTQERFDHEGPYYSYKDVPMPLRPLQTPHPPYWYASSNEEGSAWAGAQGMHFVTNGPSTRARQNIDAFKAALTKRGAANPRREFAGSAAIGVLRHIVVADTDQDAKRIAKPAIEHHAASLNWLRQLHGGRAAVFQANVHRGEDFESWVANEMVIAGSPATVRDTLKRHADAMGVNYLILYMFFGTMQLADAKRSLALFQREVMPSFDTPSS
jgi:alkanesulfonate monooxygenase SsuD/methylene tetrahydromethanopterin reductase-like flavin-dependent oxidoreductase (luciferase family)